MPNKTDKFIRNIIKGKNVAARKYLEAIMEDKMARRIRKTLAKNASEK